MARYLSPNSGLDAVVDLARGRHKYDCSPVDGRARNFVSLETTPSCWDADTECTIVFARPEAERDLWIDYVRGACRSYRKHGVERALDMDALQKGADTIIFAACVNDAGRVVAGLRGRGPYQSADECHALLEWSGQPGRDAVRKMVSDRLPFGVVEMKTAWVTDDSERSRQLTNAISRAPLHAMNLLDIQFSWRRGFICSQTLAFVGWTAGNENSCDSLSRPPLRDEVGVVGPRHVRQSCRPETVFDNLADRMRWRHESMKSWGRGRRRILAMTSGIPERPGVMAQSSTPTIPSMLHFSRTCERRPGSNSSTTVRQQQAGLQGLRPPPPPDVTPSPLGGLTIPGVGQSSAFWVRGISAGPTRPQQEPDHRRRTRPPRSASHWRRRSECGTRHCLHPCGSGFMR